MSPILGRTFTMLLCAQQRKVDFDWLLPKERRVFYFPFLMERQLCAANNKSYEAHCCFPAAKGGLKQAGADIRGHECFL